MIEEAEERLDIEDAAEALAEADEKGTISWEQIKKDAGLQGSLKRIPKHRPESSR